MNNTLKQRREAVLNQIMAYGPDHFNMHNWGAVFEDGYTPNLTPNEMYDLEEDLYTLIDIVDGKIDPTNLGDCGTTCCLAGHAAVVIAAADPEMAASFHDVGSDEYQRVIADWLDVPGELFFVNTWGSVEGLPMSDQDRELRAGDGLTAADEYRIITLYLQNLIDGPRS